MAQGDLLKAESIRYTILLLPPLAIVAVFFGYPLVDLLARSFISPTGLFGRYEALLTDDIFQLALRNTVVYALSTSAIATILSYPVAAAIAAARPVMAGVLLLLVMVPFWTSILVRAYAWIVILGRAGILNSSLIAVGAIDDPLQILFGGTGVVIGMAHVMIPYATLPILNSMRRLNPEILAAADSLGASRTQSFFRVLLPLTAPGIVGGFVLTFVLSLGFFVTPRLMGGPRNIVAATEIHDLITRQLAWEDAAAVSVILLLLTVGTFAICAGVFGLRRHMSLASN